LSFFYCDQTVVSFAANIEASLHQKSPNRIPNGLAIVNDKDTVAQSGFEPRGGLAELGFASFSATLRTPYATGINVEDALRLRAEDVDLKRRLIEIEKGSSRGRCIPIGTDLKKTITGYLHRRQKNGGSKWLFATIDGKQIPYAVVCTAFSRLRRLTEIKRTDSSFQPRILDLRHTFIVHSITRLEKLK
jgi:site-specific recombinase XerD